MRWSGTGPRTGTLQTPSYNQTSGADSGHDPGGSGTPRLDGGAAWFYSSLGVNGDSNALALLLFMLVIPVFTQFLEPLMAMMSRKHEFEADDFAVEQAGAEPMIRALVKLYRENASTLTPDPLYSAFHDSHPPASVRVANLSAKIVQ